MLAACISGLQNYGLFLCFFKICSCTFKLSTVNIYCFCNHKMQHKLFFKELYKCLYKDQITQIYDSLTSQIIGLDSVIINLQCLGKYQAQSRHSTRHTFAKGMNVCSSTDKESQKISTPRSSQSIRENKKQRLKNLELPDDSVISTPRYILKRYIKTYIHTKTCIPVFTVATPCAIAKRWKQPKCLSTDEWLNKMWYNYIMKYYSAI